MQESSFYNKASDQENNVLNSNLTRNASDTEAHVEIESDLCKECNLCVEACPPKVLRISDKLNVMGYHPVEYIGSGCTGCGICFYVCPEPGTFRIFKKVKKH